MQSAAQATERGVLCSTYGNSPRHQLGACSHAQAGAACRVADDRVHAPHRMLMLSVGDVISLYAFALFRNL
jgi:hypothetical protein